jgi:SAM-dependent methyltransferase
MFREGYSGTGPGIFTPDGCAVSLYERLEVRDEPEVISRAVPAGASILELGCGTGRMTHALRDLGFVVTAVDESPDMLSRVHGVRTVLSSIESLDLAEHFDAVLLGSFLIHAPDPAPAQALLAHLHATRQTRRLRPAPARRLRLARQRPQRSEGSGRAVCAPPRIRVRWTPWCSSAGAAEPR